MIMIGGEHLTANAFQAVAWLFLGLLLGGFHFLTLRWTADAIARGRRLSAAVALHVSRVVLVGVVMFVIARYFGALSLLSAAAGLVAARSMVLRWSAAP
jgi:hypothetical protein